MIPYHPSGDNPPPRSLPEGIALALLFVLVMKLAIMAGQ